MEFDIIVVGAGPVGAIAAEHAALQGASVLLLDKKKEVGVPVRCGEGLLGSVLEELDIPMERRWVCAEVNKIEAHSPSGSVIQIKVPFTGYILDRRLFDRTLASRAEKAGAKLRMDAQVTSLLRDGEGIVGVVVGDDEIRSKVVIGADGVEGRVGRWAKMTTHLAPADIGSCVQYHVEGMEVDTNKAEFYWGSRYVPSGYAWVFPKGEDRANVGIGVIGGPDVDLRRCLDRFIEFRGPGGRTSRYIAGCVPLSRPLERSVKDNVVLVGDAARQVNPVGGGGLVFGMISGRIAGEVAGGVVSEGGQMEQLQRYDAMWKKRFYKYLVRSYKMKSFAYSSDRNMELIFRLFKPVSYFLQAWPSLVGRRINPSLH